jgi:hypothetical protein
MLVVWLLAIIALCCGFLGMLFVTGNKSDTWRIAESERNTKERAVANGVKL